MKTVYNIQLLRAVAAYMVVAYHMTQSMRKQYGLQLDLWSLASGVDIFFVISGFVMVYVTGKRETTPLEFMVSRAQRIYPLYWLVTAIIVGLSIIGFRPVGLMAWDGVDLLASLVLFPDIRADGQETPLVTVAWTLIYEMFFYFVFAAFLPVKSVLRRVVLISIVFGALTTTRLLGTPDAYPLDVYTRTIMLEFCTGCWLGWWFLQDRQWSPSVLRCGAVVLTVLGAAGIATTNLLIDHFDAADPLRAMCFGVPATAIVAACLMAERAGWWTQHRAVMLHGAASYAVYLIHQLLIQTVTLAMKRVVPEGATWGMLLTTAVILGTIIAVGLALHLQVELPLARFLRKRATRAQLGHKTGSVAAPDQR